MKGILVYTDGGLGASHACVKLAIDGITKALSSLSIPTNIVSTTTSEDIIKSHSLSNEKTKLLVMPGGRDLPFCQKLNGHGNKRIRQFIENGGSYLGLCAGGYYACEAIEFSKGNSELEICGNRELELYPGMGMGPVYTGFSYSSNIGSRAVPISLSDDGSKIIMPSSGEQVLQVYYNGGPCFTQPKPEYDNARVLAYYTTSGGRFPAIVQSSIGKGGVVLAGPHIEAAWTTLLDIYADDEYIANVADALKPTENLRHNLFTSIIKLLIEF